MCVGATPGKSKRAGSIAKGKGGREAETQRTPGLPKWTAGGGKGRGLELQVRPSGAKNGIHNFKRSREEG